MLNLPAKINQLNSDMTYPFFAKNKIGHGDFLPRFLVIFSCFFILVSNISYGAEENLNSENLAQTFQEELDTWTLRAYEGDRDAQFKVGVLFTNDQFSEPDFEQAVYWYKQAARQGHSLAQYNLGHQYLNGVGVQQSTATAIQWWLKAAEQGHALAQFNIGRAYYLGIGLPEDHQQAKYWFQQAANNQEPKSVEILAQLGWNNSAAIKKPNTAQIETPITQGAPTVETEPEPITPKVTEPHPVASTNSSPVEQSKTTVEADPPVEKTETVSTPPATIASTSTELIQKASPPSSITEENNTSNNSPIALYTNPEIRSVLIAIAKDSSQLEVIEESEQWTTVRHQQGFPVWVHSDFIEVFDTQGTITANAVNARSIPMIVKGSIIQQLNKAETVFVINQVREWYRVVSPARFQAWVRTADFKQAQANPLPQTTTTSSGWSIKKTQPVTQPAENRPKPKKNPASTTIKQTSDTSIDSNDWLFSQPSNNYTIQLASFDTQEKVSNFLKYTNLKNDRNLHQFTSQSKQIRWTYFLYGSYPDKKTAVAMKNNLEEKQSWVRNIGKLQQNRCISWKKQLPTPKQLNTYCTP